MDERYQWCVRRVRRTWWLLRQDETRADTARYLAVHGLSYARSIGTEVVRNVNASASATKHARAR